MADVKGIVTKKIGPLPVWAYVVGGAAAVFLFSKMGGSGKSSGGAADVIKIPTLAPGSQSDLGGENGVGSPGQNLQGGSDTQPAGAPPWWSTPLSWWGAGVGGGQNNADTGGGGNTGLQSSASPGRRPADAFDFIGKTAAQIAEAGRLGFVRTSPTSVSTGGIGVVAPTNVLKGFADPVTGNLEATPGPGRVPIYA